MTDDSRIVLRSRLGLLGRTAGVVFLLVGALLIQAVLSDGLSGERGLAIQILLLLLGAVIAGEGLWMTFGYVEHVLDRDRHSVRIRRGLLGIGWSRSIRIDGNAHIRLRTSVRHTGCDAGGPTWKTHVVRLKTAGGDVTLRDREEYAEARELARRFADFLGIPLIDATRE